MSDNNHELLFNVTKPLGVDEVAGLDVVRRPGFYDLTDPPGLPAGDYYMLVLKGAGEDGSHVKQWLYAADGGEAFTRSFDAAAATWSEFESAGGAPGTTSGAALSSLPFPLGVSDVPHAMIQPLFASPIAPTAQKFTAWGMDNNPGNCEIGQQPEAGTFAFLPGRLFPHSTFRTDTSSDSQSGWLMAGAGFNVQVGLDLRCTFQFDAAFTDPEYFFGMAPDSIGSVTSGGLVNANNVLGVGKLTGSDQLGIIFNDNSPSVTFIPLVDVDAGYDFRADSLRHYSFRLNFDRGASVVNWEVKKLGADETISGVLIPGGCDPLPDGGLNYTGYAECSNGEESEEVACTFNGMFMRSGPIDI